MTAVTRFTSLHLDDHSGTAQDIKTGRLVRTLRFTKDNAPVDITSVGDLERFFDQGLPNWTVEMGGYNSFATNEIYDLVFADDSGARTFTAVIAGKTFTMEGKLQSSEMSVGDTEGAFTCTLRPFDGTTGWS